MMSKEGFYGPVNLGNPIEFTVRELAEKILAITGSKSRLIEKPLPADDPRQRKPDISLAQQQLDWTPRIQLDEGLVKTIHYFDRLLGSESKQKKLFSLRLMRRSTDKVSNKVLSE